MGEVFVADIVGSPENNLLTGTAEGDTIHGNGGNDRIYGLAGADALFGDDGDDRFVYSNVTHLVVGETVDGGNGFDTIQIDSQGIFDFSSISLTSIEAFEVLGGSVAMTTIQMNGLGWVRGSFQLTTGGVVSLSGATISSSVFALSNIATIFDLTGMLPLDPGNMTGPIVAGGTGNDQITGGTIQDRLLGGGGDDTLSGGAGNDFLRGGLGLDIVHGGEGDDILEIQSAQDLRSGEIYDGGEGFDTLLLGVSGLDLTGVTLSGIERIEGGQLTMTIAQIESLRELPNSINIASGGTLILNNVTLAGFLRASNNATTVDASGAVAGKLYFEGGNAIDTVIGSAFDDVIYGGEGGDNLSGGEGADQLFGGLGIDRLDGGAGNDLFRVDEVAQVLPGEVYTGGSGTDRIEVSASTSVDFSGTTISGIEEIVQTNYGEITLSTSQLSSLDLIRGTFHLSNGGTVLLDGVDVNSSNVLGSNVATTIDGRGAVGYLSVQGGAAADQLMANNNGAAMRGGAGSDGLTGGLGADQLFGDEGNDSLAGGGGNDELWGGDGVNSLNGGDGNDILHVETGYFSGAHTLTGGAGEDILRITTWHADLSGSTITGIERLESEAGGELTLTAAQINALGSLIAGGSDIFITDGAAVSFNGKNVVEANFHLANAGGTLDATGVIGGFRFNLYGGTGNDTVTGAGGGDGLFGDVGNDTLIGAGGNDLLFGGLGRDTMRGGDGDDIFYIDNAAQMVASEIYEGGVGNDKLQLNSGNLDVNISNSTLTGVEEIEMAFGGRLSLTAAQLDQATNIHHGTFVLTTAGAVSMNGVVSEGSLFFLSDLGNSFDLTGYLGGAANVTGGAGADTIVGTGLTDLLSGGSGNDVIRGGGGNDSLTGGAGVDNLYGGIGNDNFYVDVTGDLIFEDAGEGADNAFSTGSFYLYANVENLTLTGTANIFGVGNELANTLLGNSGENLLIAGAGNDIVRGGGARDSIFGQDGADQLFGDAGIDYIVAGTGNDIVDGGADADEIYGEDGDDTLTGGTGFVTDILVGGAGNDIVRGDSGSGDYDRLYGNQGDDSFYVDTPDDLVFENAGEGTDTVYANIKGAGYYLYANVENLVLEGDTPFGVGNALANRMTGNAIGNYLLGGAGNDTLDGMGGNDVLFGEAGNDVFAFAAGMGADVIGDFIRGQDRIDLSAFGITSLAQISGRFVQNGTVGAIQFASGDVIVLHNVQMSQLAAGDFIFAAAAKEVGFAGKATVETPSLSIDLRTHLTDGEWHGGMLWASQDYSIPPLFA